MKKLMSIAMLFAALAVTASCDKEEIIGESQLPSSSRDFLKTHFGDVAVLNVVKETDGLDKDYTVYLADGFEVDFTKSGAWDEVEGHTNAVPQSVLDLIPEAIAQYADENFAGRTIMKVNRERYGYQIGLDGGMEIEFNSSGGFLRYDD